MSYERYVAIGDSQTEGVGDGDDHTGHRGWADRLAEHLAGTSPGLHYANLAIRGRLASQVRAEQLEPAVALRPDLVTVVAGMNDIIRRHFDATAVTACLEDMYATLAATGAHVVTATYPDLSGVIPIARPLRPRVLDLNARVRDAAARHDVTVVDAATHDWGADRRLWSTDRLHANSLGHTRFAAAAAQALDLPDRPATDNEWSRPLPPAPPRAPWEVVVAEARWLGAFLGPWLYRRIRGRSSGDGRLPKRPELAPVTAPAPEPGAPPAG